MSHQPQRGQTQMMTSERILFVPYWYNSANIFVAFLWFCQKESCGSESYGSDACFFWVLYALFILVVVHPYIYIYILSDNVFKFCVYINIWLAVFPCPRSDVLLHCVRTHKLRCVFLLPQVTTGYNPCGAPEKSFDVLKHFLWTLNPVYNVLKLFLFCPVQDKCFLFSPVMNLRVSPEFIHVSSTIQASILTWNVRMCKH